jgi:hypothetical protein
MEMKKDSYTLTVAIMIAFCMILTAITAMALNPPPGGAHYQGPAIRGQIIFERNYDCNPNDGVLFSFSGTCGRDIIEIEDSDYFQCDFDFDDLDGNEAYLEENLIPYDAISSDISQDCLPNIKDSTPDGLQVIQILSWTESPNRIVADVVMIWVVPK